jgi:hypothetical protein
METIKKIANILFLFVLSGTLPKFVANILTEGGGETLITNVLTLLIDAFLIKCCFYWLDTKNKEKKLFDPTLPTQTNQLTPFFVGILIGIQTTIRYYQ